MERVEVAGLPAIDTGDGLEVRLTLANSVVSVRRRTKLVSREIRTCRGDQISLVNDHTIDLDGVRYQVESAAGASAFVAAARASASGRPGSSMPSELSQPLAHGGDRWQYAVIDTGAFNTSARLATVLAATGQAGWELVTIYDKSSNWLAGMEKGFMLLRRRVPPGLEPESWAIQYQA